MYGFRSVFVDELLKQWRAYGPGCVIYQTSRMAAVETVFAVCGDRAPVGVASTADGQWSMDPDGLRRTRVPRVEDSVAVSDIDFVALADIRAAAQGQPPIRDGWARDARTDTLLTPSISRAPADATALVRAAGHGQLDLVDALLRGGADPNVSDLDVTPLIAAAAHGYAEVLEHLIASGATVNVTDRSGSTALIYAARARETAAVRTLLAGGADGTIRNNTHETAADQVRGTSDQELFQLLEGATTGGR